MSGLDDLFGKGGLSQAVTAAKAQAPEPEAIDAEPAAGLARELGVEGKVTAMGSNTSFLLSGPDRLWLLLQGGVDVFYVVDGPTESSQGIHGIRTHVARIEAGGAVFGIADTAASGSLVAVPINGTRLVEATRHDLHALARNKKARAKLATLVESWVGPLLEGMAPGRPPGDAVLLSPGESTAVAEGTSVEAAHDTVWITAPSGAMSFFGATPAAGDGDIFLPLTNASWLTCGGEGSLTALTTEQWLEKGDFSDDLDCLHGGVLGVFAGSVEARSKSFTHRFLQNGIFSRHIFTGSLRALAGVLEPGSPGDLHLSADPLVAAAQTVAHRAGIEIAAEEKLREPLAAAKDPLKIIARQSGFFTRAIALEGEWWRVDQGPILAFQGEDEKPCALLPVSARAYELVDPVAGTRTKVTREIAATVSASAHYFYRPFQGEKMCPSEILMFGLRGSRRDGSLIVSMILVAGLLSLATPIIVGWIMDPIIPEAQLGQLAVMVTALVIAGLSMVAFSLVQSLSMLRIEGRMTHDVQAAVWDRLLKLPASFFRDYTVGDLANRAQSVDSMRSLLSGSVVASLMHSVVGLFSLGLMTYYNWRLAGITVIICTIYSVITYVLARKVLSRNREMLALSGRLQGIVMQLLGAVSKLRVTGSEPNAFAQWAMPYARLQSISFYMQNLNNALVVFKAGFNYFAVFGIILVIGWQGHELLAFYHTPTDWADITGGKLQKVMPTAKFVSFHVAFGQFLAAVFGITGVLIKLINIKPLYERVAPILEARQESEEGSEDPGEVSGGLAIHDVQFRYEEDSPLVLDGMTFEAKPGQFVALVGPSGAGKSSVVRLILGFDEPEAGSVFLDDKDISNLDKRAMRHNFGVVLQNGRLLSGSVFHNITAGANLSHDDAWEAARLAGLDKDIEAMPMGMETYLGEGASTLSGGQRQRLMIARAVVHRPRILIFDEATSALDNETQEIVRQGLDTLNSTRIVIAHRLSTIINADMIYVIDKGRVIEAGKYQQLMDQDDYFAEMARRQIS